MNRYEKLCLEWLKGCSCSESGHPEQCKDCTEGFLEAVKNVKPPKKFEMTHRHFTERSPETFTEETAPDWLTSKNTVPGSTMDNRWFWDDHVMRLSVGGSVDTEFRIITRIE